MAHVWNRERTENQSQIHLSQEIRTLPPPWLWWRLWPDLLPVASSIICPRHHLFQAQHQLKTPNPLECSRFNILRVLKEKVKVLKLSCERISDEEESCWKLIIWRRGWRRRPPWHRRLRHKDNDKRQNTKTKTRLKAAAPLTPPRRPPWHHLMVVGFGRWGHCWSRSASFRADKRHKEKDKNKRHKEKDKHKHQAQAFDTSFRLQGPELA